MHKFTLKKPVLKLRYAAISLLIALSISLVGLWSFRERELFFVASFTVVTGVAAAGLSWFYYEILARGFLPRRTGPEYNDPSINYLS